MKMMKKLLAAILAVCLAVGMMGLSPNSVKARELAEYYLVGEFSSWRQEEEYKFVKNTEAETEEYVLKNVSLSDKDELKVQGNGEWYPREGNNYKVDSTGFYNVYFRPNYDGGDDWHYNCIYLERAEELETTNITVGIIADIYDLYKAEQSWKVHYWGENNLVGDVELTDFGGNLEKDCRFFEPDWGEDCSCQFLIFHAQIPSSAAGYKVHCGDNWFGENATLNKTRAYVLEYNGEKRAYYYDLAEVGEGYYLVGNFNDWKCREDYKLTSGDDEVWSISRKLNPGDRFKVLRSSLDIFEERWYADGSNQDYIIQSTGNYTIYFNTFDSDDPLYVKECSLAFESLSLEKGDIAVNFYFKVPDDVWGVVGYFSWKRNESDEPNRVDMSDISQLDIDGATYFKASCHVDAAEMTSKISVEYSLDGGGTFFTKSDFISVQDYADVIIKNEDSSPEYDRAKPLVKAMLNYGAAAQKMFDVKPENLANSIMSEEDQTIADIDADAIDKPYDPTKTTLPAGVSFKSVTLSLKSQITLSLYFQSDAALSFSCDGMEVVREVVEGYQVARIRGIPADRINDDFVLEIDAGDGNTGYVTYSPMTYCYNVLNRGSSDENLTRTVQALYWYHDAAKKYFTA